MDSDVVRFTGLISVCICTFKRPEGLHAALVSMLAQDLPPAVKLEVVVVDNDPCASARELFVAFRAANPALHLLYANETKPGVSFARNRCLREASGDWIAFLDDDETAPAIWLVTLLGSALTFHADAVFGPVLPVYETAPPDWMQCGGAINRNRFDTGTSINWTNARTGNVLISRRLTVSVTEFDARFSRTGGEDSLYFANALKLGYRLVWCDEGVVNETVPKARMTKKWVIQRAFLGGRTFVRLNAVLYGQLEYVKWFVHGIAVVTMFSIPTLYMWLFRRNGWMCYVRKLAGALGKIAAPVYDAGEYGQG